MVVRGAPAGGGELDVYGVGVIGKIWKRYTVSKGKLSYEAMLATIDSDVCRAVHSGLLLE